MGLKKYPGFESLTNDGTGVEVLNPRSPLSCVPERSRELSGSLR